MHVIFKSVQMLSPRSIYVQVIKQCQWKWATKCDRQKWGQRTKDRHDKHYMAWSHIYVLVYAWLGQRISNMEESCTC